MSLSILTEKNITMRAKAASREEAIREAGDVLVQNGYVEPAYVEKMLERERVTTTYMGNLLAIPHGTEDAKANIKASGISVLLFEQPVDWDGHDVRLVIGIAGKGDEHLDVLSKIAILCSKEENVRKLLQIQSADEVLRFFSEVNAT